MSGSGAAVTRNDDSAGRGAETAPRRRATTVGGRTLGASGPSLELFDVVVLGGGPGAVTAAQTVHEAGRTVVLVATEESPSACLWHSSTSGRSLGHVASAVHTARTGPGRGVSTSVSVNFGEVFESIATLSAEHREDTDTGHLLAEGIDVREGRPRFLGPDSLSVDGRRLQGRRFVLAPGAVCRTLDIAGIDDVAHLTAATLWELRDCPERLLVLGDGAEACEMAQTFARLGSEVTLLSPSGRLLPGQEPQAGRLLTSLFRREGITVAALPMGARVASRPGVIEVSAGPDSGVLHTGTTLLVSAGCQPDVRDLALEVPGVRVGRTGHLRVDDRLRAETSSAIFAIGQAIEETATSAMADEQARLAVRNLLWDDRPRRLTLSLPDSLPGKWHPEQAPAILFTDPQVARVGLSEDEAAERYGGKARVAIVPLGSVDRTSGAADGFVKLVAAPGLLGTKNLLRLVGMSVVGADAGDVLAQGTLAIRAGVPLTRLATTLTAAGTWAGAVQLAASLFFAARDGLRDRPAVRESGKGETLRTEAQFTESRDSATARREPARPQ